MLGVNQVKTEPLVDGERTKQMFDNSDHRPAIAGALRGCFRRDSGGGVEDDAETSIEVAANCQVETTILKRVYVFNGVGTNKVSVKWRWTEDLHFNSVKPFTKCE